MKGGLPPPPGRSGPPGGPPFEGPDLRPDRSGMDPSLRPSPLLSSESEDEDEEEEDEEDELPPPPSSSEGLSRLEDDRPEDFWRVPATLPVAPTTDEAISIVRRSVSSSGLAKA